jgi:hypothetical protein
LVSRVQCPSCKGKKACVTFGGVGSLSYNFPDLERRTAELDQREKALKICEADHQEAVKLIQSCLHPDKYPGLGPRDRDRITKAFQAFKALLESAKTRDDFDDEIPF